MGISLTDRHGRKRRVVERLQEIGVDLGQRSGHELSALRTRALIGLGDDKSKVRGLSDDGLNVMARELLDVGVVRSARAGDDGKAQRGQIGFVWSSEYDNFSASITRASEPPDPRFVAARNNQARAS
jgi:hypothetical protein